MNTVQILRYKRIVAVLYLSFLFIIFLEWICIPVTTRMYKRASSNVTFKPSMNFNLPAILKTVIFHERRNEIELPWYFMNGKIYPEQQNYVNVTTLLGHEDINNDRILEQLMFYPSKYNEKNHNHKLIYIMNDRRGFGNPQGTSKFSKCPVKLCKITRRLKYTDTPDLLIFKNEYKKIIFNTSKKTINLLYILESPNVENIPNGDQPHLFNWTATYRLDSDIVAPYEKWVYYNTFEKQKKQNINYAKRKTKKVAWMVSNCYSCNERLQYAKTLGKYIQVDIYGKCGPYVCEKHNNECLNNLKKQYKFYLAFENSNCKDYVTEKFFLNALQYNTVPIVMGATPEQYERIAPKNSYIHVNNFSSPQHLASYLKYLDTNDAAYNLYFNWKGTGEFIDTHFWCRLCALLHDENIYNFPKSYKNIQQWWAGNQSSPICRGECKSGSEQPT